jgi:hypothetical protein
MFGLLIVGGLASLITGVAGGLKKLEAVTEAAASSKNIRPVLVSHGGKIDVLLLNEVQERQILNSTAFQQGVALRRTLEQAGHGS